jgi:hypothetical protein
MDCVLFLTSMIRILIVIFRQVNKQTKQKDMIANADNATSFFRCSDYFTAFIAKSCDSDTIWVALNETSLHTTFFLLFNIFFTLHSVKVKDEKKKMHAQHFLRSPHAVDKKTTKQQFHVCITKISKRFALVAKDREPRSFFSACMKGHFPLHEYEKGARQCPSSKKKRCAWIFVQTSSSRRLQFKTECWGPCTKW